MTRIGSQRGHLAEKIRKSRKTTPTGKLHFRPSDICVLATTPFGVWKSGMSNVKHIAYSCRLLEMRLIWPPMSVNPKGEARLAPPHNQHRFPPRMSSN